MPDSDWTMGSCPLRGISFGSLLRSALGLNTHLLALLVHYPFDFLLIDDEASLLFESDACLLASRGGSFPFLWRSGACSYDVQNF